jgi:hypothetical protein
MDANQDPPRQRRPLRIAAVIVSVLALLILALGVGDVVRAAFQAPPVVKPYDPMPRW